MCDVTSAGGGIFGRYSSPRPSGVREMRLPGSPSKQAPATERINLGPKLDKPRIGLPKGMRPGHRTQDVASNVSTEWLLSVSFQGVIAARYCSRIPTIEADIRFAIVPAIMARKPSLASSPRLFGASALMPPI